MANVSIFKLDRLPQSRTYLSVAGRHIDIALTSSVAVCLAVVSYSSMEDRQELE